MASNFKDVVFAGIAAARIAGDQELFERLSPKDQRQNIDQLVAAFEGLMKVRNAITDITTLDKSPPEACALYAEQHGL